VSSASPARVEGRESRARANSRLLPSPQPLTPDICPLFFLLLATASAMFIWSTVQIFTTRRFVASNNKHDIFIGERCVHKQHRPAHTARRSIGAAPQEARAPLRCSEITGGGNFGHLSKWLMKTKARRELRTGTNPLLTSPAEGEGSNERSPAVSLEWRRGFDAAICSS
jgi:hypothetical protein